MIIIAREELNKAAAGLNQPRKEATSFDKWMTTSNGNKATSEDRMQDTAQSASQNLYRNRLTRFE